jgi:opacity protein-like surface antigen
MKQFVYVGTMVLVCLALASPVVAQQPASDAWQVTVTTYLMGAAISGTTGVRGVEAQVDLSASDVFSNLEFGAMGIVAARKGNWGIGTDVIFMALGATADRPAADVDFNQTAFAVYGLRRLNAVAEATFGVRVNGLDGGLTFKEQSVVPAGTELSQSKWWVDPIVGLRLHTNSARRVNATLYGEIGGFGLGSDLAWQIFPVVDVRVTERMSLDLGYRWLSMNYTTGDGFDQFTWDTLTQGPVVGFKFQF